MKPCEECLEQRWEYEKLPDCYLRATCQECNNVIEWQSKKILAAQKRRLSLLKNQIGTGAGEEYIWTMVDGKHFRNGIEMILVRKGRDEKCTIGYAMAPRNKENLKNRTLVDPKTYVHPPQRKKRTGYLIDV